MKKGNKNLLEGALAGAAYDQSLNGEVERWQKITNAPYYQKVKAVEDLFNEKIDNIRVSEKLARALETWMVLWRDKILGKIDMEEKNGPSLLQIAGLLDSFQKARILLAQNINPKLVIEQILLSLRA